RLEQVFSDFGWPSAARFELGTLDGMIGCVAAGMGVTLLPRAVVERSDQRKEINIHALDTSWSRVDTLFVQRRRAHQCSALCAFVWCVPGAERDIAASRTELFRRVKFVVVFLQQNRLQLGFSTAVACRYSNNFGLNAPHTLV